MEEDVTVFYTQNWKIKCSKDELRRLRDFTQKILSRIDYDEDEDED